MDFEKQGFKIITKNIVILMLQIAGTVFYYGSSHERTAKPLPFIGGDKEIISCFSNCTFCICLGNS